MNPTDHHYTRQDLIEGVVVIGFTGKIDEVVPRGPRIIRLESDPPGPRHPYLAEMTGRLARLEEEGQDRLAIVDFSDAAMLDWYDENHRGTVSLILQSNRRLKALGGGLLVCNHLYQFNPDHHALFGKTGWGLDVFRTLSEALDAVHARLENRAGPSVGG